MPPAATRTSVAVTSVRNYLAVGLHVNLGNVNAGVASGHRQGAVHDGDGVAGELTAHGHGTGRARLADGQDGRHETLPRATRELSE